MDYLQYYHSDSDGDADPEVQANEPNSDAESIDSDATLTYEGPEAQGPGYPDDNMCDYTIHSNGPKLSRPMG